MAFVTRQQQEAATYTAGLRHLQALEVEGTTLGSLLSFSSSSFLK